MLQLTIKAVNISQWYNMQLIVLCTLYVGTETPWSQWTCFNDTAATRSRTVQNCTDMEFINPVTNMTTTNTTCVDVIDIDIRTGKLAVCMK